MKACLNNIGPRPNGAECLSRAKAALAREKLWTPDDYMFLAALALGPIILLWLGGAVAFWTVRWIAAGFPRQ